MVVELNASDDRGIDVVREQIKTFASTKQIFNVAPSASSTASIAAYKLIILDEADAMTSTAQMALRRIMEKYTANTRFCIIANYTHKLSRPFSAAARVSASVPSRNLISASSWTRWSWKRQSASDPKPSLP